MKIRALLTKSKIQTRLITGGKVNCMRPEGCFLASELYTASEMNMGERETVQNLNELVAEKLLSIEHKEGWIMYGLVGAMQKDRS